MVFDRPGLLAGFRFDRLLVRTLDFPGHDKLPGEAPSPDEVVVARPLDRQRTWPAVTFGTDLLDRCSDITYSAQPRSLTLRCAFDAP
jgi:hypothetical protein